MDDKLLVRQTFALADLMALPKARSQTPCIKAIVKVHLFRMCSDGNVNVRNTLGACLLKGEWKSRSMAIFITKAKSS